MTEPAAEDAVERRFLAVARLARKRRGWSQGQVAEAMAAQGWPWHQQTVAKAEQRGRLVRLGEAVTLAAILDIDLSAFVDGEPEPWRPCRVCAGKPPAGFTCDTCRKSGARAAAS